MTTAMRKVVINRQYGGFGLSPKAVQRLAELEGKACYFFTYDRERKVYEPIDIAAAEKAFMWFSFTVPNPVEVAGSQENWSQMSEEERYRIGRNWDEITLDDRPAERDNANLVKVVEELGDAASGKYATLRIVEIPASTDYEIEEYDGMEHIAEKHRTWS